MNDIIAFFTVFDPLALLFIVGVLAFVVAGGLAVMRDEDTDSAPEAGEAAAEETSGPDPVGPRPDDGASGGGVRRRGRPRAA